MKKIFIFFIIFFLSQLNYAKTPFLSKLSLGVATGIDVYHLPQEYTVTIRNYTSLTESYLKEFDNIIYMNTTGGILGKLYLQYTDNDFALRTSFFYSRFWNESDGGIVGNDAVIIKGSIIDSTILEAGISSIVYRGAFFVIIRFDIQYLYCVGYQKIRKGENLIVKSVYLTDNILFSGINFLPKFGVGFTLFKNKKINWDWELVVPYTILTPLSKMNDVFIGAELTTGIRFKLK